MAEEIYVGLKVTENVGLDTYALGLWMFKDFNDQLGPEAQPGHSGVKFHPLWDQSMPYWFIANGQRLMVATKVSTVYTASHAGKFLPYGTPGEYPQPYYLGGCVAVSTDRWSTTSPEHRNFWDPGEAAVIHTPAGVWSQVENWRVSGGLESVGQAANSISPYNAHPSTFTLQSPRYRELRENADGTYPLWELVIVGDAEIYGTLDGAYAVTGFGNAAENIVTVGGVDHIVLQDIFRSERWSYAALALE